MIISGENLYTLPTRVDAGLFEWSVRGTFVGTVTVQWAAFNEPDIWYDNKQTTITTLLRGVEPAGRFWRAGFKLGDYVSGSADIQIRQ